MTQRYAPCKETRLQGQTQESFSGEFNVKLITRFMVAIALAMTLPWVAMAAEQTAVESAEQSVDELLATVQELKGYFESDPDRYYAGIQESLTRFVDFNEVA